MILEPKFLKNKFTYPPAWMPSHVEESLMSTLSLLTPASSYKEMSRRARSTIPSLSKDNLWERINSPEGFSSHKQQTWVRCEPLPGVHLCRNSTGDLLEDLYTEADKQLVHRVCELLLFSPRNITVYWEITDTGASSVVSNCQVIFSMNMPFKKKKKKLPHWLRGGRYTSLKRFRTKYCKTCKEKSGQDEIASEEVGGSEWVGLSRGQLISESSKTPM